MNYCDFKALRGPLEARLNKANDALRAVPGLSSGQLGLTPDAVKARPDYRVANDAYNAADKALRAFDRAFTKAYRKTWPVFFKKELRAERDARRAQQLANGGKLCK